MKAEKRRARLRLHVSAGALLLYALLIYFSAPGQPGIVLLPVLAHEAGHLAALRLLGLPVRELRLELAGLRIDCVGSGKPSEEIAAALAGPAAGLLYAVLAFWISGKLDSAAAELSAGVSLLLSLFNLLPLQPLDGGRVLSALAEAGLGGENGRRLAYRISLLGSAMLLLAGLWFLFRGEGAALALAGVFLLGLQLRLGLQ